MRIEGYQPVQLINYALHGYCVRFMWSDPLDVHCISVDVILRHQRGIMLSRSADVLVSGRRRHGVFWIPSPEAEFAYLLAKKSWKGGASARQKNRLKALVDESGALKLRGSRANSSTVSSAHV